MERTIQAIAHLIDRCEEFKVEVLFIFGAIAAAGITRLLPESLQFLWGLVAVLALGAGFWSLWIKRRVKSKPDINGLWVFV